jgi:hypothetical protein
LHSIGHLFKNSTIFNYFLNFKKKFKLRPLQKSLKKI